METNMGTCACSVRPVSKRTWFFVPFIWILFIPLGFFFFFFFIFNVTWDFLDRSIRQDMFVHCVGSPVLISKMNDPFIYFFYFFFLKNDIYLFRGAVLIKCANIKHPTSLRFQLNICLVTTDIRHWEMRVERYSYLLFFLEKRWH